MFESHSRGKDDPLCSKLGIEVNGGTTFDKSQPFATKPWDIFFHSLLVVISGQRLSQCRARIMVRDPEDNLKIGVVGHYKTTFPKAQYYRIYPTLFCYITSHQITSLFNSWILTFIKVQKSINIGSKLGSKTGPNILSLNCCPPWYNR